MVGSFSNSEIRINRIGCGQGTGDNIYYCSDGSVWVTRNPQIGGRGTGETYGKTDGKRMFVEGRDYPEER